MIIWSWILAPLDLELSKDRMELILAQHDVELNNDRGGVDVGSKRCRIKY